MSVINQLLFLLCAGVKDSPPATGAAICCWKHFQYAMLVVQLWDSVRMHRNFPQMRTAEWRPLRYHVIQKLEISSPLCHHYPSHKRFDSVILETCINYLVLFIFHLCDHQRDLLTWSMDNWIFQIQQIWKIKILWSVCLSVISLLWCVLIS